MESKETRDKLVVRSDCLIKSLDYLSHIPSSTLVEAIFIIKLSSDISSDDNFGSEKDKDEWANEVKEFLSQVHSESSINTVVEHGLSHHEHAMKAKQKFSTFINDFNLLSGYNINDFINRKIKKALENFVPSKGTIQLFKSTFVPREEHKSLHNEVDYAQFRMDTIESTQNNILEDMNQMKTAITNKAEHSEVEKQLKKFAFLLKQFEKSFESYTLKTEYLAQVQDMENLKTSLDSLTKDTYSSTEIDKKFKSIYK